MKRVFVNLLSNAVEASNDRGEVAIRAVRDEDDENYVICQVKNTGGGLSDSMIENLFSGASRSSKKGGMGLGLLMVKKIVELHGSRIAVRSEPIGSHELQLDNQKLHETTVSWHLKIHSLGSGSNGLQENLTFAEQEPLILKDSNENLEVQNDTLHVCLVDDDHDYLSQLKTLCLETIPGSVVVCMNGPDEAVKALAENSFDLIISDVEFGLERDGFWLLREVVGRAYLARVVLHSGPVNPDYESTAIEEGAFEYVAKPMTDQRLRDIVGRLPTRGEERIVCCIDDELNVVRSYLDGISDARVVYFESPDAILDAAKKDPEFWSRVEVVLSDYYFGFANASEMKLVRSLRRSGFKGPVILFSNIAGGGDVGVEFDGKIDKMKIPSIKWLLEKTARPV